MNVRVQKLAIEAVIPQYAKEGDAGMDLTAITHKSTDLYEEYGTGLAFEIPEGYVGLLFPRSSVTNKELMLKNSIGVIDSTYRGEVKVRFENTTGGDMIYAVGERIAQLIIMPYPKVVLVEVAELTDTSRGEGGFGSTGK